MKIVENEQTLHVTVSDVFDYDKAKALLLEVKRRYEPARGKQLVIDLVSVPQVNSCAIGALILLAELAPGRFRIGMREVGPMVREMFSSGILDRFFTHRVCEHQPAGCATCFEAGRPPAGAR